MKNASRLARVLLFAGVVVSTVGCDQASKQIARGQLAESPPLLFLGGLVRLNLAMNEGGFLGLGSSLSPRVRATVFRAGVSCFLILCAVYLLRSPTTSATALACGWLAWAGGLSNLLDRLMFDGRVTDFVVVGLGPLRTGVFNLADVAIFAGVALLFLATARMQEPKHA